MATRFDLPPKPATSQIITKDKIPAYVILDPLKLDNGTLVKDAATWNNLRRPEILKKYETEIYGRIPATAPKVTWEVASTDPQTASKRRHSQSTDRTFWRRQITPAMHVNLYLPANATGPVPVVRRSFGFGGSGAPSPNLV